MSRGDVYILSERKVGHKDSDCNSRARNSLPRVISKPTVAGRKASNTPQAANAIAPVRSTR
eukprot:2813454-Lingulodinium_polyedra.AAC.1